ncbi:ligand-binding sensor domain-containing protein [Xanthomonas citri]|nr:two-component regulator propeller domain-containing protein [Xanthomonas citri]
MSRLLCPDFGQNLAALWLVLVIAALPVLAAAAVPTTPVPIQLTVADGLPSNTVNDFAEDKNGYLWLATADGLARFDGRNYRIWRMEDGLTDNFVWAVGVDAEDGLWVGLNDGGVGFLDPKRRTFTPFKSKEFPELSHLTVWAVAQTPDGDLWFGTSRSGVYRRRPNGSMQHFMFVANDANSLPSDRVTALRVTADGTLWIGSNGGIARWNGMSFDRKVLPGNSQVSNGLRLGSNGDLWVTDSNNGLYRLESSGNFVPHPWKHAKDGQDVIGMLLHDRRGHYWLDTMSGLGISDGAQVQNVPIYSLSAHGLVKPSWASAYEDREGGLWFTSLNGGLWHLPPNWSTFSVLSYHADDPQSMANPLVQATAMSASGGFWIGGSRGALERLDPFTGKLELHLRPISGIRWPS